jgi:hypothetical protein
LVPQVLQEEVPEVVDLRPPQLLLLLLATSWRKFLQAFWEPLVVVGTAHVELETTILNATEVEVVAVHSKAHLQQSQEVLALEEMGLNLSVAMI